VSAAVIITHNRPALLRQCVAAIQPQVDFVIVIDNASNPPAGPLAQYGVITIREMQQPPNIAAMWNRGIDAVNAVCGCNLVAFLCDDAIVPKGWFDAVTDGMVQTGAVAGCSDPFGNRHRPILKTRPDGDLYGRMVGWAFVLDLSSGIRADESMHWWWCDTDVDWQARAKGGMVMVGGHPVPNELPNDFTGSRPELGERTGVDAAAFAAKWGSRPW
jgi:glycosyltransferase involved in cell wall biosynthesis